MQIVLIGGRDARNGVSGAVKDENSITFSKKEDHLILEIKEYIENDKDVERITEYKTNFNEKGDYKIDIGILTKNSEEIFF